LPNTQALVRDSNLWITLGVEASKGWLSGHLGRILAYTLKVVEYMKQNQSRDKWFLSQILTNWTCHLEAKFRTSSIIHYFLVSQLVIEMGLILNETMIQENNKGLDMNLVAWNQFRYMLHILHITS